MYVLCKYIERPILRILSENKNREKDFPNQLRCMTIEYLKCRADLNFEVDFGSNAVIGTVTTWCMGFYLIRKKNSNKIPYAYYTAF